VFADVRKAEYMFCGIFSYRVREHVRKKRSTYCFMHYVMTMISISLLVIDIFVQDFD